MQRNRLDRLADVPVSRARNAADPYNPHVKLGRRLRFKKKDVIRWVEERSVDGRKTRRVEL